MTKREIRREIRRIRCEGEWYPHSDTMNDYPYWACFIGSYMAVDPCGRYHHCLSPNGVTKRCTHFWTALEDVADELKMWIESGEGNATDIYLCRPLTPDEETLYDFAREVEP